MRKFLLGTVAALFLTGQVAGQPINGGGGGSGGSGTVTNVATGTGLSGGPCTTTCTIAATPTPNQLSGLGLSNDSGTPNTVFDIAAGQATDGTNATSLALGSAFTKTTGAFVAGTGNGALDTGSVANSTWYHVYLIAKAAGASPDILISLSASSPTMPSTYTLKRRIGSIKTDASGHLLGFVQLNDTFLWKVPVTDLNNATTGACTVAGGIFTLSTPLGVQTTALFTAWMGYASTKTSIIYIWSPDATLVAPTSTSFDLTVGSATTVGESQFQVRTNTSSQVNQRCDVANSGGLDILTKGWIDDRGMGVN